ncbi:esterase/lipase [Saccharomonospora marina XMU15]|uniref:Esterase/lipase n=1 Tax=Saccharomonospora marina XMU15 TaxID=882083 RepID=H5X7T5_9PSEU|nr:alpha/beta hydrolase fold domain-containing protein [Saccharomonospora marina]EHR52435.1 esterase/lipase [Saccharomonospora marina XMU15]
MKISARTGAATRPGPPPRFDPELAGPVARLRRELDLPLTRDKITASRARGAAGTLSDDEIRRGGAFDFEEHHAPGPSGAESVRLLVCRPTRTPPPHPVLFNIHGGGMVAGGYRAVDLADELERAEELQCAVVSVEYRLAPEHPDPAPVEDCYAGLRWVMGAAADQGLRPEAVVVSGNSAGGGLAAGVALLARDRGGPRPLGQLLQCPMLDDRCDTPSSVQQAETGLWDGTSDRTGWTALLGDRRGTTDVSPYAAPARATDLARLPPAYLDVGAVEALRDSTVDYASRIWLAGGDAELHIWSGAFHSFDWWVPDAAVSRAARRSRVDWLRRLLRRAS